MMNLWPKICFMKSLSGQCTKINVFATLLIPKLGCSGVAKNLLIDLSRKHTPSPAPTPTPTPTPTLDNIEQIEADYTTVDKLANCLPPRVLKELNPADSELLIACDIQGMTQQQYATKHGLSLPAVKSRLLRARKKLRQQLTVSCQVKLDENMKVCCFTPRD